MKKRRSKKNTYSRQRGGVFRRWPISYSENEKAAILVFFKEQRRDDAFNDINACIAVFIGQLKSNITPRTILRSPDVKKIKQLEKKLDATLESIIELRKGENNYATMNLERALNRRLRTRYRMTRFADLCEMIVECRAACLDALEDYALPGHKNPEYHRAIKELVSIWIKYTHKRPRRRNTVYKVNPYLFSQKETGDFLVFLRSCILPALSHADLQVKASIATIAREVMAKIPPK